MMSLGDLVSDNIILKDISTITNISPDKILGTAIKIIPYCEKATLNYEKDKKLKKLSTI